MRYFLLALLMHCNTYTGIVVEKDKNSVNIVTEVGVNHYILPSITIDQYDSIVVGDTLVIDRTTLRLIYRK